MNKTRGGPEAFHICADGHKKQVVSKQNKQITFPLRLLAESELVRSGRGGPCCDLSVIATHERPKLGL